MSFISREPKRVGFGTLEVIDDSVVSNTCSPEHEIFVSEFLKELDDTFPSFNEVVDKKLVNVKDPDLYDDLKYMSNDKINPFIFIQESEESTFYAKVGVTPNVTFNKDEVATVVAAKMEERQKAIDDEFNANGGLDALRGISPEMDDVVDALKGKVGRVIGVGSGGLDIGLGADKNGDFVIDINEPKGE